MTDLDCNRESEAVVELEGFSEQYFRKSIGRLQRTVAKVRRIDLGELLEMAWVDGMLEPFAERLARSRPDLKDDIVAACREISLAD